MLYVLFMLAIGGGGAAGFCIAWFVKNKELALKDQELAIEKRALEEREKGLEQLEDRFKAVASDVMRLNRKDFLEEFERARKVHNADLETKEKGIERIVDGLRARQIILDTLRQTFRHEVYHGHIDECLGALRTRFVIFRKTP